MRILLRGYSVLNVGIRLVKRFDFPFILEASVTVGTLADIKDNFLFGIRSPYKIKDSRAAGTLYHVVRKGFPAAFRAQVT